MVRVNAKSLQVAAAAKSREQRKVSACAQKPVATMASGPRRHWQSSSFIARDEPKCDDFDSVGTRFPFDATDFKDGAV